MFISTIHKMSLNIERMIDRQINLPIPPPVNFSCNSLERIYFTGFSSNSFHMISATSHNLQFCKFTNLFSNPIVLSIRASGRNGLLHQISTSRQNLLSSPPSFSLNCQFHEGKNPSFCSKLYPQLLAFCLV